MWVPWLVAASEGGEVAGGGLRDIEAGHGEDLGGVDRAHDLAAARVLAGAEEQTIERDAFVAQRVALVD